MSKITKHLTILILLGYTFSSCIRDNHWEIIEDEKQRIRQYVQSIHPELEPTQSGLYYVDIEEGTGSIPEPGDFVLVNYTGKLLETNRIFGTTDYDVAVEQEIHSEDFLYGALLLEYGFISPLGINEGLSFMKEGGKSRIFFPSTLGFGRQPVSVIPAYSSLIYDIELIEVIPDPVQYQKDMITKYLNEMEIQAEPDAGGLYYIEHQEGIGPTPDVTDLAEVSYKAYLMDGRLIASTGEQNKIYSMQSYLQIYFNQHFTISGLRNAILKMRAGGKATVIVPYDLAFGQNSVNASFLGYKYPLPPYSSLRYEIELVSIK